MTKVDLVGIKSKDFPFCVPSLNLYREEGFFDFSFNGFFSSNREKISCQLLS